MSDASHSPPLARLQADGLFADAVPGLLDWHWLFGLTLTDLFQDTLLTYKSKFSGINPALQSISIKWLTTYLFLVVTASGRILEEPVSLSVAG